MYVYKGLRYCFLAVHTCTLETIRIKVHCDVKAYLTDMCIYNYVLHVLLFYATL